MPEDNEDRNISEKNRQLNIKLAEASPALIWLMDQDGLPLHFSPAWLAFTGFGSVEEAFGRWREAFHPDDIGLFMRAFYAAAAKTGQLRAECRLKRADGWYRWLLVSGAPFSDKERSGYCCAAIDITDRKAAEEASRINEAKYQAIFQAMPDLVIRLHRDGTLLEIVSDSNFPAVLSVEGNIGRKLQDLLSAKVAERYLSHTRQACDTGKLQLFEFQIAHQGEQRYRECRMMPLGGDEVIAMIRDITERKVAEEQLAYVSFHDTLTGLYNRAYFEQRMEACEDGGKPPVGIALCDLDGLKLVNDTLGHDSGDVMLLLAAGVLKGAVDQQDMICRIGGDEFAIIMPGKGDQEVAAVCAKIRRAVREHNSRGNGLPLSISVGYAVGSHLPLSMEYLLREADNNMYREKLRQSENTRSAIVQTVMKLLEGRDYFSDGHANRMQNLVLELAEAAGLQGNENTLRLFAQFHDIGKVGVRDEVLFKPGQLMPDEKAELQRHSEIGHRIANSAPDLFRIADWILKHHEWWNGNGYPLGIKGEEIPLECRILAIADAYDAMTSERPYRNTLTSEAALAEIKRCSGTQFDPQLVEIFVRRRQQ